MGEFAIYYAAGEAEKKATQHILFPHHEKTLFFAIAVLASLEVFILFFFLPCVVYIISFNQRCHQIVF